MKILSTNRLQDGCFMPVAWAAEKAFSKIMNIPIVYGWNRPHGQFGRLGRLMSPVQAFLRSSRTSKASHDGMQNVMLVLMGVSKVVLPVLNDPKFRKWLYLFDTWEPGWGTLEDILRSSRGVQALYLSSSQAARYFSDRFDFEVHWLPQAANSAEFSPKALNWEAKRDLILNFGRVNKHLDTFFLEFSKKYGFEYVKDDFPGQVKLKTRTRFLKALYDARIVVVHPRNFQEPEITGSVSMLTARNFEAYQSGGIVCGYRPDSGEFDEVLRDFPFIEYTISDRFEAELLSAMKEPEPWLAAVARCRREHTWESRAMEICSHLRQLAHKDRK